jgi:hypothetical protein
VVLGESISFTLGASVATVVGGSAALALGGNFALTIGANMSLTLGVNQSLSFPEKLDFAGSELRATTSTVNNVVTRVDNIATNMHSAGVALISNFTNIATAGIRLYSSDLYVMT